MKSEYTWRIQLMKEIFILLLEWTNCVIFKNPQSPIKMQISLEGHSMLPGQHPNWSLGEPWDRAFITQSAENQPKDVPREGVAEPRQRPQGEGALSGATPCL